MNSPVTKLLVACQLLVAVSCSDESANTPIDAGDEPTYARPPLATAPQDRDMSPEREPCDRPSMVEIEGGIKVSIPSPCREYDIVRDLPRPIP
jgi:hypothetical protein